MRKSILLVMIVSLSASVFAQSAMTRMSKVSSSVSKYGKYENSIKNETINGTIPSEYPSYIQGVSEAEYKEARVDFIKNNSHLFKEEVLIDHNIITSKSNNLTEDEYVRKKYNLDRFVINDPELIEKSKKEQALKNASK